jgi:hypothetical protein
MCQFEEFPVLACEVEKCLGSLENNEPFAMTADAPDFKLSRSKPRTPV